MLASFIHLSDIQFGHLCDGQPLDATRPESVLNHDAISSLLEAIRSWPRPTAICLTGDLTSTATPTEFRQAVAFSQALRTLWGAPDVQLAWVAGNHDVSWHISKASTDKDFAPLRFLPYRLGAQTLSLLIHDTPPHEDPYRTLGKFVHTCRIDSPPVRLLGINTAVEDDHDVAIHCGLAEASQLERQTV